MDVVQVTTNAKPILVQSDIISLQHTRKVHCQWLWPSIDSEDSEGRVQMFVPMVTYDVLNMS